MLRRSALIVLILVLAACSSSTPPPSGPSVAPTAAAPTAMPPAATTPAPTPAATAANGDKATIYIYRQKAFMGMALRPTVMVDGKDLVNIGNGRLYVGYFTPGSYNFQMDDKKSGAKLDLKSGDVYYMRVDIVPGFWKGGGKLSLIDAKQAVDEVKGLTPIDAKEVEDKSRT
ncbi:MAG TPA: DUF2846 domain-containing protein [Thermoanaerobaculia bacterium]|nr:DUF2846 domain-containing protein [Thermoanaerobaculia bacterium]